MTPAAVGKQMTKTSLHQLINDIIQSFKQTAIQNKSSFLNTVPSDLYIGDNLYAVASVINGVLETVIANTNESNIYVSAGELYGSMAEVNIKDENCYNTYVIALNLQSIVPLAEKANGKLNISHRGKKITTVTFRFPVMKG